MPVNQLLRAFLVRFPWLFRALNSWLPGPVVQLMRRAAEKLKYHDVSAVHELPDISHYWGNRYLLPRLQDAGYNSVDDFFLQHIARFRHQAQIRIASIGSGNCEQDIHLVRSLLDMGIGNLRYECLEFNKAMLVRARVEAHRLSVAHVMLFNETDIAHWQPQTQYEVVLARQFLHHVPALETLFATIKSALTDHGLFLVDDMIGRNGHMRWPEALELVNTLWAELDDKHKFHHLHRVTNRQFVNWDCSLTGFEGIRAQDILPLLLKNFGFESFFAFGNLIEVFVDRPYGPNFNIHDPKDLAFIDRVQALDQACIDSGRIKPTHMFAALCKASPGQTSTFGHLTPEFCVRMPNSG